MQTPAKQKLLFFAIIFFASPATLRASDGPADSDSWDSDLQSSLDSISETPAQPEPSADADLTQESSSEDAPSPTETESSQDKTRYAVPPTISEPAGSAGNSTPPKSMVQPSSDSMIQRKAADLITFIIFMRCKYTPNTASLPFSYGSEKKLYLVMLFLYSKISLVPCARTMSYRRW